MAPYKLEDNIREKLEAREMKPSAEAWKKLEAQLETKQPKKKTVVWYYIAASFVGLLILASVFFSRNNTEVNNQIVDENSEKQNIDVESEIIPNNSEAEEIASETNNSEKIETNVSKKETEKKQSNSVQLKPLPQKKSALDKKIEKTDAIAKVTNEEMPQVGNKEKPIKSELSSESIAKLKEDKIFNTKVDEVVASVKKLQENNTEVSTTEVEALLNSARREIQTQRILNSPKVDAMALLQDVEWELEKSFRDKVFDALGEGFQKVRTAVNERND
ncbi:hypothetical protein [Aequorivita sp. CIP111184]|uniref:hypothetical protein n=1 Tax=Aequorivita sp. CIP111184 TaxID=2211356 RepID=UPI000DBBBADC|nr:hypothetical protein [Aequorivita sp. CIP111184]SRX54625.1 hypothetical protein AEQU1_01636 [Aequorivita sp. CIP111184]